MALNSAVQNLFLRVKAETADAESRLGSMAAALKAWGGLDEEAEAKLDIKTARRNLFVINKEISDYARQIATAGADVDTKEARSKLDLLEHALNDIDRTRVSAQTNVQIARSLTQIGILREAMSAAAHLGGGLDDNQIEQIIKDFTRLATVSNRARASMATGSAGPGPFEALTRNLRLARANIGPFVIGLQGLGKLWLVLIPKVGAFAAGLLALASSAGSAVLGLGALATAAAAVAAPLGILGIAAGAIFAHASQGLTDYRTAMESLRQATRAQEDAERNLAQAQHDADDAQKNLTAERRQARQDIDANVAQTTAAQADAEFQLQTAQENATLAQRALNQARIDATRALIDMKFAAQGAALSEKGAAIALERARNQARKFAKDDHSLKAREARLAVQEAELQLKTAREEGKRTQDDLTVAENRGIDGSDQMIQAREGVEQANYAVVTATRDLTKAIEDSNLAQKQTVANSENVLSARKRLHAVNRQIVDQERQLKFATQDVNKAQRQLNRAQRDAAPLMRGAGLALRKAVSDTRVALIKNLGPGVNRIWRGVANGLENDFIPLLRSLRTDFRDLGSTIGKSIQQLFARLNSDDARAFFSSMIQGAAKVVPLLTKGFFRVAHIFANIAEAALPHLINGLKSVNHFLKGLSDASDNPLLGLQIGGAVSALGDWLKLIGSIIRALFNLGSVATDDGTTLIQWITKGVNAFADWASSTEGQDQIQQFLDDMIPLFKGIVGLLIKVVQLFINLSEIFAPIARVVNAVLQVVLDVLNKISGALADMPGIVRLAIGGWVLFKGPINILKSLFGWVGGIVKLLRSGEILGALRVFTGGLSSVFGGLLGSFKTVGSKIGALASRALPALGVALRAVPYVGAAIAVAEYGDDVGKAVAEFAGYSDEVIQAQEDLGNAQSTLSDHLFKISQVIRNLRKGGAKDIHTKEDIFNLLSPKELQRAIKISERGGQLIGHKFIDSAIAEFEDKKQKVWDSVTNMVQGILDAIQGFIPKLIAAGQAIWKGVTRGMKGKKQHMSDEAKTALGALAALLPGSEPKDASSPLRGLEKRGAAIVNNIAKGIAAAGDSLPDKLSLQLNHAVHGAKAAGKHGGGHTTNHYDLRAVGVGGGGYPNADEYMAAVSRNLRKRGLSLA